MTGRARVKPNGFRRDGQWKRFAAGFTAARVKPGCHERERKRKTLRNSRRCGLGKTEPRSREEPKRGASRGNSPEAARVKPGRVRASGDGKQQLRESIKRGRRGLNRVALIFCAEAGRERLYHGGHRGRSAENTEKSSSRAHPKVLHSLTCRC